MSETKTKNLCTVPAADLTDSQYFIAEDGGELKRIPKAQVVLKKLENMLATDTENLAGGGEVTAQELLDALAEQVANKLLAKSQVVNNLLATVEGNPLDATQGKALKELIDTTNNNLSNTVKISPALIKNAIIARGNAENRLFDLSVTLSDETIAYLNVEKDTVRATTKKDGTWTDLYTLITKSDLFGELCTNPNTFTALIAMVNGYDSNISNVPDAAKKKFSVIQNVWASPNDMGDLTKTHMQVLIIGNGGGVVTRKYESNAWSSWQ